MKTYRPMRMKEPGGPLALPESVSKSWVWDRNNREKGSEVEQKK